MWHGEREGCAAATRAVAQFGEPGQGLYAAWGATGADLVARRLGGPQRPTGTGLEPGCFGGSERPPRAGPVASQLGGPRRPAPPTRPPRGLLLLGVVRFVVAFDARWRLTGLPWPLRPLAGHGLALGVVLGGQGQGHGSQGHL